jgi:hypothetical protein
MNSAIISKLLHLFLFLSFGSSLLLAHSSGAMAQPSTPDTVVKKALKAVQNSKNVTGMLDYVDWQLLYAQLDASGRKARSVTSAEDLREYNRRFFTDPRSIVAAQIDASAKTAGSPATVMSEEERRSLLEMTAAQIDDQNRQLSQADYTVGKPEINGENASVPVTATVNGKSASSAAHLRQTQGEWRFVEFPIMFQFADSGNQGKPPMKVRVEKAD